MGKKAKKTKRAAKVVAKAQKLPTLKDIRVPKGGLLNPALRKSSGKAPAIKF